MTKIGNFRTLLNWVDCKELYMSLNGKAAECLTVLSTTELVNLDSP